MQTKSTSTPVVKCNGSAEKCLALTQYQDLLFFKTLNQMISKHSFTTRSFGTKTITLAYLHQTNKGGVGANKIIQY